jgi:hypothetical protein
LAVGAAALLCASSAQAAPIRYTAELSGLNEVGPNASPGSGVARVIIDTAAHTLTVKVSFADLTGNTTASHIHCCVLPGVNAGVATQVPFFAGFPIGVTAGTYTSTFDTELASSFNAPFITANGGTVPGAEAALALGLAEGKAYFNIHTSAFPGGELRGNLAAVPEPATLSLLGLGAAFALVARRKRGSTRR